MTTATALAHPNIALVKYWGKRDVALNLPDVPSLSLTLDRFVTRTTVTWGAERDEVLWNGARSQGTACDKVLAHLDRIDPGRPAVHVDTSNNFPTAAGLASSASGFAALTLAGLAASGQQVHIAQASALARQGSGSACRSLWGGFVEWARGELDDGSDSHGIPLMDEHHWDVAMVVAVVSSEKKPIGSTAAMLRSKATSPYYDTWVQTANADVDRARAAVLTRDLEALGTVMERSTLKMHATMHTSWPTVNYWLPGTLGCLHAVSALRQRGVGAWATMDAGPNVKVLCLRTDAQVVADALLGHVERVEILRPGGPATVDLA
ncbi:MAG: diphosphomevalonate decarboxylase [Kiritimatiellia bacterium]|jgi:diphosphomevalonate decarboxylase